MASNLVWPVAAELLPTLPEGDAQAVARLQAAIDTATVVLWRLTGAQYGLQRLVARPCPRVQDTHDEYGITIRDNSVPVLYSGEWHNIGCMGAGCQSDGPGAVKLPGPVHAVEQVVVSGAIIAPESYTVEGDRLIRAGGHHWPAQNLQLPMAEPGAWYVVYLQGIEPPSGAASVLASLAGEFYKAVAEPTRCRLPKGWQTVQRQGVTVQRMDTSQLLNEGRTGLSDVDLYIKALNPNGLVRPTRVASPDTLGGR